MRHTDRFGKLLLKRVNVWAKWRDPVGIKGIEQQFSLFVGDVRGKGRFVLEVGSRQFQTTH